MMNIQRAKEEIKDAIEAYFLKDEYGEYVIPTIRQRPIFLIGAPGIGKTQIMEQIARECGVGLVSYTITHHTRQSAIGLPFISKESFGGKEYAVTEYTMSEIVASIYHKMEATGLNEGILFIDEINCVSETLAPAMLQFLQCKSFGNHQIPQGWLIVAAGNPPEYNRSVREFDVVTMDRVKKIEVGPDFEAWKSYAYRVHIHPAVISYLNAKPLHFYKMETTVDGKFFATPRGWEDLSRLIEVYEKLNKTVDREVIIQYIQHPKIAKDFANYLELYYKYQADYQIEEIFAGNIPDILLKKIAHASFDEKLSVISLLLAKCSNQFKQYCDLESYMTMLHPQLLLAKECLLGTQSGQPVVFLEDLLQRISAEKEQKQAAELLTAAQKHHYLKIESFLEDCIGESKERLVENGASAFAIIKEHFGAERQKFQDARSTAGLYLERAFDFLEAAFGNSQEIVTFITELNTNYYSVHFLQNYECERYYRYNQKLLFEEQNQELMKKIDMLL